MKRRFIWVIVIVIIVKPAILEDVAMVARVCRFILARLVLGLWIKGGGWSAMVTDPIHKWLRSRSNGRTKEWVEQKLTEIDIG